MDDWYPYRRSDGEQLGWIRPEGDRWVPISLLGRELAGPMEWLDAEAALDELGLAWLAEPWELEHDGRVRAVRLVEVTPERVVVKTEDWGAIDAPFEQIVLPFPAPAQLRARTASAEISFEQ